MMAEAALFTAAMSSFMLSVVSIRKQRALLDLLESPIVLPGGRRDTDPTHAQAYIMKTTVIAGRKLRDADRVSHCRKV